MTITPTFAKSIKRLKDASTVEATIDQAISNLEGDIADPISVTIDFKNISSGLGESQTPTGSLAYSTYLSDLDSNPGQSADDKTALASLPAGPDTGINDNTDVTLTATLFAALGDTLESGTLVSENNGFNGTILLNLRIMNRSRIGKQNPRYYDLESVAARVGPMDLFRYTEQKDVRDPRDLRNNSAYSIMAHCAKRGIEDEPCAY